MWTSRCLFPVSLFVLLFLFLPGNALPDQGKWDFTLTKENSRVTVVKSLFQDARIYIQIECEGNNQSDPPHVSVSWKVMMSSCWQDYLSEELMNNQGSDILDNSTVKMSASTDSLCSGFLPIKDDINYDPSKGLKPRKGQWQPVYLISDDGFYILTLSISSDRPFLANVHVEMPGKYGYLSAADWPLLPFYGAMCLVYVVLGLAWLIVSFLQWRDLLRIQFWIGGVILLGMLEKATFYAEYSSINSTGDSMQGAVLIAELVSCGKRTLARMLVIIVSLGFGIVKPRLGPMLHRVVGVGILYFVLAASESYMRVMKPKNDPANQLLVASVPLAVLDSAIFWWIFNSLVQTTRTLRLRRNLVKLNLYRHFTNTLIFAVLASVLFMLYSIKVHHLTVCFKDWKELWVDDAYWRLLFSVILLVIMILWRPTNNNQRYAFSPLLDAADDDDDEEEEQFVNDAYGVKMRGQMSGAISPKQKLSLTSNQDEDLKWVEENIPASLADTALPILDSDEEIMTTRFELSKMQ